VRGRGRKTVTDKEAKAETEKKGKAGVNTERNKEINKLLTK
jgi:hypothetical protein